MMASPDPSNRYGWTSIGMGLVIETDWELEALMGPFLGSLVSDRRSPGSFFRLWG